MYDVYTVRELSADQFTHRPNILCFWLTVCYPSFNANHISPCECIWNMFDKNWALPFEFLTFIWTVFPQFGKPNRWYCQCHKAFRGAYATVSGFCFCCRNMRALHVDCLDDVRITDFGKECVTHSGSRRIWSPRVYRNLMVNQCSKWSD